MPKKLLLADDSLTIHRVVELTFADEDFEVISVSNGTLAIDKINSIKPDVIIADVNMPEKDGYEVCAYVKNNPQLATVPVLLLRGTFEPFNQDRADEVRADGIIQKPFQSQILIDKVNSILGVAPAPPPPQQVQPQPQIPLQPPPTAQPPQQQPQVPPSGGQPFAPPLVEETKAGTQPGSPVQPQAQPEPEGEVTFKQPEQQPPRPQQFPAQAARPGSLKSPEEEKTTVEMLPVMDDTPFGISAPFQQKQTPRPEDGLSKDASEAGKAISDAFSPPKEGLPDIAEPQKAPEKPPIPPPPPTLQQSKEAPIGAGQKETKLPDFSDAMSDVSMAFNKLSLEPELKPDDIPPAFQQEAEAQPPKPKIPQPGAPHIPQPEPQTQYPSPGIPQEKPDIKPQFQEKQQEQPIDIPPIVQPKPEEPPQIHPMPPAQKSERPLEMKNDQLKPSKMPDTPASDDSNEQLAEQIAQKVLKKISEGAIKEIAWDVVPDLIEKILKEKLNKENL
jgi:CheY-like chemotaxis protein